MRAVHAVVVGGLSIASVAAFGQILTSPGPDFSQFAKQSDLAAVAASVPTPMLATPPTETVGGAPGTAGTYRTGTAVQPRISRTVAFTTASDGTAAVTWPVMPSTPLVFVVPNVGSSSTQAPVCSPVVTSITTTGATVKCWTTQSVTVSLLGAVVAPIVTAGAGVTGQVLALPAS